jgi:hypothetical protein
MAFGVWMLNQFIFLFSVLSLPIVIVNFFIIAVIFITYLLCNTLLKQRSQWLPITLSLLLGAVVGCGNCFRPVFPIAIIALFLLFIYLWIKDMRNWKLSLLLSSSFLLVVIVFFGIQKLNITYVSAQTGLPASGNGGWNVYVGSNSETDGTWNQLDQDREKIICQGALSNKDCQGKLQHAGIARYKQQGTVGIFNLFIRKIYVFSSDQYSVYNANNSIGGYVDSSTQKRMGIYTVIFVMTLFALSVRFLYLSVKRALQGEEITPIVIFTSSLMLGFFFSSVFVETSSRYALVMYPMFTIFAVLALSLPNN